MALNLAIAHKLRPPEATQEPHPPTSLNMVECPNHKDLSQLVLCPLNNLPVNFQVKVATAARLSLQHNTPTHKCTEVPPALVVTAVVSQLPMLSGVLLQPKVLEMALVATKDNLSGVVASKLSFCVFSLEGI